jgi:hypothetical protein
LKYLKEVVYDRTVSLAEDLTDSCENLQQQMYSPEELKKPDGKNRNMYCTFAERKKLAASLKKVMLLLLHI